MSAYFVDTNVILNYCHEFEEYNEKSRKLIDEKKVHCSEVSIKEVEEVKEYNDWVYLKILRTIKEASVTDRKLFEDGYLPAIICTIPYFRKNKYSHVNGLIGFVLQKARKSGGAPDRRKLVTAFNQTIREIADYAKQAASQITKVPIVSDGKIEAKLCKIIPEVEVNDRKIVAEAGYWFNNGTHLEGKCFVSNDIKHIVAKRDFIIPLIETHFAGKFRFNLMSLSVLDVGA